MTDFSRELAITLLESTDDYPVDLDDAWQWLGYNQKADCLVKLKNNFEEGEDFSGKSLKSSTGGRPKNCIMLTVDCFKMMGMLAGTEKGKEIRRYFLECEKIAKQKTEELDAISEMEMIARTATRIAELRRKALEQDRQLKQAEERLTAIEAEQGRLFSPSGNKYTVIGFAKKQGLEISCATAGQKGKKAVSLCRQRDIEIERIHDPRFGYVGLYPESILIEVFK